MKKKFQIDDDQDIYFVDEKDGAVIEDDVIKEVLEVGIKLMVLREGEEWGEYSSLHVLSTQCLTITWLHILLWTLQVTNNYM